MTNPARTISERMLTGVMTMLATAAGIYLLERPVVHTLTDPALLALLSVAGLMGLGVALDISRGVSDSGASMRLPFLSIAAAARFYDVRVTLIVAAVAALAEALPRRSGQHPMRMLAVQATTSILAAGVSSLLYTQVATRVPHDWPWASLPMVAFAISYSVIAAASSDFVWPLVSGVTSAHHWPHDAARGLPGHVMAAAVVVALSEIVHRQAWALLAPVLFPLAFAWFAYRRYITAVGARNRRLDVVRSTDHGVCVVDDHGVVRTCNAVFAALVERRADQIVDRSLVSIVPDAAKSELLQAVKVALTERSPRTLSRVRVRCGTTQRVISASVLPDIDGALIVCQDVSDTARWEDSMREYAERFAIVSQAANDGMWELDLARNTLFVSPRWRVLVGLPAVEDRTNADAWFSRVHASDLPELQQAIEAMRRGESNRFELRHRLRHENGSYRSVVCRAVVVHDQSGTPKRIGGSVTDVTDDAIAQAKIHNAESRDPLTGLLNRAAFVADLGRRLKEFRERRGTRFATLYLDLDRFKVVNDSLGHLVGDELLVEVSRRLETCLRPGDAIARLGGDEFAILLHGLGDEMQANVIAFRLQEALHTPFPISGRDVVTSASIGIAFCRQEYESPEEIMRDADTAMYHAKAHGKARHELFDADMHARALDRLGLESDLRHAVKNSNFEVHYQPIVSLSTRMCTGFESLVRWNRNGKPVSPAEFVPMAEELGIIEPLGTWVMREACRTFAEWQRRFPESQLEYVTVNVSAKQLVQQGFIYLVEQVVEQNEMSPADLRLEITETALMDAPQFAAQVLSELREFGVKIYLDDFGTGYSSLSHLHKLPVDALKIDRSFVRGLLMTDRPAIVESILALAHTLHTNVVAEGVEDEMQATELERLGCSLAQGYYFSRPVSAQAIEAILASGEPLGGPRMTAVTKPGRRALAAAGMAAREIA
ncbi:MAG: EAL domain-containing protein [Vicinamibacterales bacterium]